MIHYLCGMFTGIIESMGTVESLVSEENNVHITVGSSLSGELKIDQSVAHNGVCLTVVDIGAANYSVTAIAETLQRTNIGKLQKGDAVNLERCMALGARLDGHIVQGHVDQTGTLRSISDHGGSYELIVDYDAGAGNVTVEKGSIALNGVSLTVVQSGAGYFSVAIIPYTWEHTNLGQIKPGDTVNLEFDIIGKYVARLMRN